MIVKVLREFYDKDNLKHLFKIGEEVEFADARAMDIISRGLGECVTKEAETPEVPAEPLKEEPVKEEAEEEVKAEEPEAEPLKEEPAVETPIRRRGRPARN